MRWNAEELEYMFTSTGSGDLHHERVGNYRCKTVWAGDMADVAVYPCGMTRNDVRSAKRAATPEQIRRQNEKNAKRKLEQLVAANFGDGDLAITLTYAQWVEYERAQRDIRNFIRSARRWREKHGLSEIKYVYAIERHKSGCSHIHIILPKMERDAIEKIWRHGYANARRLQPGKYGLIGISRYLAKDPQGTKRWVPSKNLKKPIETVADKKVSKRMAAQAAAAVEEDAAALFERLYPGYEIMRERPPAEADYVPSITIKRSEYLPGVYIYARLQRKRESEESETEMRAHTRTMRGDTRGQKKGEQHEHQETAKAERDGAGAGGQGGAVRVSGVRPVSAVEGRERGAVRDPSAAARAGAGDGGNGHGEKGR